MTDTITPQEPRSWHTVLVGTIKGKLTEVRFTSANVFFWDGVPIAVLTGSILHFHCAPGQQQRTINELAARLEVVAVRADPAQFDFVLGSTLTQAGLPLTKRQP